MQEKKKFALQHNKMVNIKPFSTQQSSVVFPDMYKKKKIVDFLAWDSLLNVPVIIRSKFHLAAEFLYCPSSLNEVLKKIGLFLKLCRC